MNTELDDDYADFKDIDMDIQSLNNMKEKSAERRRAIRESIELREMARELDISYEDFQSTLKH